VSGQLAEARRIQLERRRHMDVKGRYRTGRAGIPWDSVRHATLIALTVAAPLIVGIGTGHDSAGAAATLGAYLWTIGTRRRSSCRFPGVSLCSQIGYFGRERWSGLDHGLVAANIAATNP